MFYSDEYSPPKRAKKEPHLDFAYHATREEMKKYIEENMEFVEHLPDAKRLGQNIIASMGSFGAVDKSLYSSIHLMYDESQEKQHIGSASKPMRDHAIDSSDQLSDFFVQFVDAVHRAKQEVTLH
jgi:hypothetical protein